LPGFELWPHHIRCVTHGRLLNLSVSQLGHYKMGHTRVLLQINRTSLHPQNTLSPRPWNIFSLLLFLVSSDFIWHFKCHLIQEDCPALPRKVSHWTPQCFVPYISISALTILWGGCVFISTIHILVPQSSIKSTEFYWTALYLLEVQSLSQGFREFPGLCVLLVCHLRLSLLPATSTLHSVDPGVIRAMVERCIDCALLKCTKLRGQNGLKIQPVPCIPSVSA
jgi:hypothetical protein